MGALVLGRLPGTLLVLRASLGPLLLVDAWDGEASWFVPVAMVLALLSDILDGVIARRVGVATERLRAVDSGVDSWFILWAVAALVVLRGELFAASWRVWAVPIGLELVVRAVDALRFRRPASHHARSAKVAGIVLCVSGVGLLASEAGAGWLLLAVAVAVVAQVEHVAISLVLPAWRADVRSLRAAWEIRRAAD